MKLYIENIENIENYFSNVKNKFRIQFNHTHLTETISGKRKARTFLSHFEIAIRV